MLGSRHILIVEPNPDVRSVVGLMLEGGGYTTSDAGDATAARDLLKQHPDIVAIVLDATLYERAPSLSGPIEARRLPLVMMSGRPDAMEAADAESRRQFLWKPFNQAELLYALHVAIDSGIAGPRGA